MAFVICSGKRPRILKPRFYDQDVNSELYEADYEIERPYQHVVHEIYLARLRLVLPDVGD